MLFIEQLRSVCAACFHYTAIAAEETREKVLAAFCHWSSQQRVSGPGFATVLYTASPHYLSTNPIYHQSLDPVFLLSEPGISAEPLCYRLISKPEAREVSPILLLLLLANKSFLKHKSWDMEEVFTDLFVVATDEEKSGRERECKATDMITVIWARVGWSFPWRVCLNFFCLKVV